MARKQIIRHHESLAEMVEIARGAGNGVKRMLNKYTASYENKTVDQACHYVLQGATHEQTREVRELLDKIDSAVHDREQQVWMPSVAGAYPVVPEYLSGMPENMRARRPVESDQAPVTIYIESSLSGELSPEATARRGAAIAALAMRMGEERPVELRVFKTSYTDDVQVCWTVKLDSHPVNPAQCMAVFGTGAFCRAVGWAYLLSHSSRLVERIDFGFGKPGDIGRADKIRKVFGANPQDIIIEAGHSEHESLLRNNPVAWVHKQLEKQRNIQD